MSPTTDISLRLTHILKSCIASLNLFVDLFWSDI